MTRRRRAPADDIGAAVLARIAVLEATILDGRASLDDFGELARCREEAARLATGAGPDPPAAPDREGRPQRSRGAPAEGGDPDP